MSFVDLEKECIRSNALFDFEWTRIDMQRNRYSDLVRMRFDSSNK